MYYINRLRKIKSTIIYNESKIENIFNVHLLKSSSFNKKELDIKITKKVLRELSIMLCLDLEPCYKIIERKFGNKKSISFVAFRECLLNYINIKESKFSNILQEQKNIFNIENDYFPTNEDMMNNKENILKCINSTDDINLIMLHRSLYILKKKFEQNKKGLKKIYNKYGEYLEKEEEILIDQNYIASLLKDIFNLNKFEISYSDNFKEALDKEMDYCKEINIDEYIFNEFIEFIKNNRKRYNFIFREKRNNTIFNLENYEQFELNLNDDLTKENEICIINEDEEEKEINNYINNIKNNKISSAKYKNKLFLEKIIPLNKDKLKINLDLIQKNKNTIESNEEDKDNTYSYSESEVGLTNRGGKISSRNNIIININNEGESGSGTLRSRTSTKRKNQENNNNIIEENVDEEKESINKISNDEKENEKNENSINNNDNENNANIEDNENIENYNNNINNINNNVLDDNGKENLENTNKNNENNENSLDKNKNKSFQLLFSSKKKKIDYKDKVFYETIYDKNKKNIKSVKFFKYYLYIDILPLIIADFISDERNLYLILDHSDDFRNNLSSIFDVEILSKLGDNYLKEVLIQRINKLTELKKNKLKVEKNIENYEKLCEEMKNKNQNIEYIIITLQKLKEFLNWLNTKIHVLQNDIIVFQEYERNKKEKEKAFNFNKNVNKIENNNKTKKQEIIDNYKQMKKDLEIRKFIIDKNKMINSYNKLKLKPIRKNKNNNSNNNNSKHNISNIENENSNNNIDSADISDEYNNSFLLSENNISNKKKQPSFYYPKVKKLNVKNSYDNIMTEKKVYYEENDDENDIVNIEPSNNDNILNNEEYSNDNYNIKINKKNILKNSNLNEQNKINKNNKSVKFKENIDENENEEKDDNYNYNKDNNNDKVNGNDNIIDNNNYENNLYNEIKINNDLKKKNIINNENILDNNNDNNKVNKTEVNKIINKNKKMNIQIKDNKKTKKILKSIHNINNNNNINSNNLDNINVNNANIENKKTKNDNKIKKKVRYVLKKLEEPKNLSKSEKRELAIKEIFDYYTNKNSIIENKSSTFDKIQNKTGHLSLNEYCRFCNDFKIPLSKDKIFSLFNKSTSNFSKIMTFQEFKISLISMSFTINDYKIEEINRSIDIFIGKTKLKNKEKSRFEKYNEKEMERNKEIIQEKMEKIDNLQKKSENELVEEFFEFLEIDDENKYRQKMKGIFNMKNKNEINLPKLNIKENALINNKKNEYSKSNSLLTYNKKENINTVPKIQKINIGKQIWIKDMVDKEKGDTPKRQRYIYESEESEEEKDEKNNNLPIIEPSGIPLFSKKNKTEGYNFED